MAIWVVDTETGGLNPQAVVLEIAAVNVDTGEEFYTVPFDTAAQLATAEPEALAINRYYERRVFRDMLEDSAANFNAFNWLRDMLNGGVFAGCNPAFDAPLISRLLGGAVWHHRLLDLSAYAAGVLGLSFDALPGLHTVCELLGVANDGEHSALGDARATAECFRRLRKIREEAGQIGVKSQIAEPYPGNVECSCGDLIHPDMPSVIIEADGALWHGNTDGGGHRADVKPT